MRTFSLVTKSLLNRKFTTGLTIFTIGLSVFLLLSVERVRTETRHGFTNAISGTDLIVGPRSGSVQLLLYSIFHIGNATNNISYDSYQRVGEMRGVDWVVPISLGDSHRGFRVMGTTTDFFKRYKFSRQRPLTFTHGTAFTDDIYHAVLGAEVADRLGYNVDDPLIIAHGTANTNILKHKDKPFSVVGILNRTGTPLDRAVLVPLEGITAIHIDWGQGVPAPAGQKVTDESIREMDLTPVSVTTLLVGLTSKIHAFKVQRLINEYPDEPLLAILPGIALQELWRVMNVAEKALIGISIMVIIVGLAGMMTAILTSLNERRREIAILRSVGARPTDIFSLLIVESLILVIAGVMWGVCLLYICILLFAPLLQQFWGVVIPVSMLSMKELYFLTGIIALSVVIGIVPGYQAYRHSLNDGLSVRI